MIYEGIDRFNVNINKRDDVDPKELLLNSFRPIQHPKNIDELATIEKYKVPSKNLTPYYQIPP